MCSKNCEWGITLLRVALGLIFFIHGAQKVFGWHKGTGLEGFALWASIYEIPVWLSYAASYGEAVGGFLLILGSYTIFAGCLSIAVMIGALYFIYTPRGYSIQNNGYEYIVMLIIATTTVMLCGSGISLKELAQRAISIKRNKDR